MEYQAKQPGRSKAAGLSIWSTAASARRIFKKADFNRNVTTGEDNAI